MYPQKRGLQPWRTHYVSVPGALHRASRIISKYRCARRAVVGKGGVGSFRLDNDYDNTPDYKYTRQAIQINQQVYQEYLESLNNTEEE